MSDTKCRLRRPPFYHGPSARIDTGSGYPALRGASTAHLLWWDEYATSTYTYPRQPKPMAHGSRAPCLFSSSLPPVASLASVAVVDGLRCSRCPDCTSSQARRMSVPRRSRMSSSNAALTMLDPPVTQSLAIICRGRPPTVSSRVTCLPAPEF